MVNSKASCDKKKHPEYTETFADVYEAELDYVKKRREHLQKEESKKNISSPKADLVGLALSGGGVRSATFNLGLLQSLAKNKVLQSCDYLSTVSGGGYIGSCLSSLLAPEPKKEEASTKPHKIFSRLISLLGFAPKKEEASTAPKKEETSTAPEKFPLRNQHDGKKERDEVNHLRKTMNYLGFGRGIFSLNTWETMGRFLSGFMLMMPIPLAILLGVVLGLWWWEPTHDYQTLLTLTTTIAAIGLLWIMLIRLRHVSVFFEWALMFIIPSAVLFLTFMVALSDELFMEIPNNNISEFVLFIVRLITVGVIVSVIVGAIVGLLWIMSIRVRQIRACFKSACFEWGIVIILIAVISIMISNISPSFQFETVNMLFGVVFGFLSVVILWNMVKRISQMRRSGYYSYELRRQHDKRIGWRLAMLSGLITAILLGGFIYKYAHDLKTLPETNIILVIMFVSIGSILVLMAGHFLNLFKKAQEKLTSIVVSIALVILFSAFFSLLLAGSFQIEGLYKTHTINTLISTFGKNDPLTTPEKLEKFKQELENETEKKKYWDFAKARKELLDQEKWSETRKMIERLNNLLMWLDDDNKKKLLEDYRHLNNVSWLHDNYDDEKLADWNTAVQDLSEYKALCSDKTLVKKIYCHPIVDINEFKEKFEDAKLTITILVGIVIGILFIIGFFTNLNYNSMHYFYRNHLADTYLIRRDEEGGIKLNQSVLLDKLHENANGPYHLINTTLNVPDSKETSLSGRGADFFIFSMCYCGAESTGYRRTDCYRDGKTKLATAMAISGAAASPEMGSSTNPGMAALMTLLNIRLNLWMLNPKEERWPRRIIWPLYLIKELLRQSTEHDTLLNLSDGGHHENLGIYPLLKRRCRLIIASDAGADPDYQMKDFSNLQRKARIDLGINIDIDLTALSPDEKTRYTKAYFVKGTIHYPEGEKGTLFYIKTTMTGNEPEDLLAYRRNNPDFPDETTADQFFNEPQFESYRKLGEWIGDKFYFETLVKDKTIKDRGFDIFTIDSKSLKPVIESIKIADLENVIVNMEKPVTFYPPREDEFRVEEEVFCDLAKKILDQDRLQLVEIIREWFERKSHQHLLWFASEVIGYFKLCELRDDLLPFCQPIMDDPKEMHWSKWELNCLWAYARFHDYEHIHKLLQTTPNADIQKWLLEIYPRMVAAHPEESKTQDFISEINLFLQRSEIQDDLKTEAKTVLEKLENLSKTVEC
jgi:hypothetical protein